MIYAKYLYFPDRREYVGAVFDDSTHAVLTVGAENTEAEIIDWCKRALANNCAPDMYDRTVKHGFH